MSPRSGILILLISGLIFIEGCWDYRELNELSLAMAMGVDKDDDKDGFRVTFQIVNPKEVAGRNATGRAVPVAVYSDTGQTIFEAIRKVALKGSRRINLQHLRILIMGESLARDGVKDVFDFMERDHESRLTTRVYIARGNDAETVLNTLTLIDEIPANAILGKVKLSERAEGENYEVRLIDAIHGIFRKTSGLAVSGITLVGNAQTGPKISNMQHTSTPAELDIAGMAILKDGKLTGWLKGDNARGVTWVNNKLKSTIVNLKCKPKGKISIETYHSSTKIRTDVRHGLPIIHITIRQTGKVAEADCPIDLTKSSEIRNLERKWEEETKHVVVDAVEAVQRLKSDVLGFGEAVERERPRAWKEMKDSWEDLFPACETEVTVKSKIMRTGMRTKSSMSNK
ncbi:Ger(x)C family spore germination protein [Cohnella suwonensis]|uniref:Ger(X)C family spore germination protein n=1 Tax=Cohnella suwonensis TaxID=696072 RepID=A0ABW0LQH9_9BACL